MSNVTLLVPDQAAQVNFEARRNASFSYTIAFEDVDSDTFATTPTDLTGCTAVCTFWRRASNNEATVVHTASTANDELTIGVVDDSTPDPTTGTVTFDISVGTMQDDFEARTYEYELYVADGSGEVDPTLMMAGTFRVIGGTP